MENQKNVIYTFSNIDEPLLSNISNEFETKMFGKINKNNIKEIQISSLSAENELEAELENIYLDEDDKNKIIVFKFNPYETDIMNYIKYFIENHIKEKNYEEENKNKQKAFIFSVHMNRIFEEDKKDSKKKKYIERNELGEIISHLSDFYQIFIDNLNGEDISIIDIMNYKDEELFRKCIDIDREFLNNIYQTFSYFAYSFTMNIQGIDKDNYSKKLIEFLKDEKDLRESIINCILSQKTEQKDILSDILKKNYFSRDDVGIISVIKKHIIELFTDNLTQFVFKTEKDHFLSTFIFNQLFNNVDIKNNEIKEEKKDNNIIIEEKNDIKEDKIVEKEKNYYMGNKLVKKYIEIYLETLDISQTARFKKKIKNNKITILLGLRLPGIRININVFKKYIKDELKDKFFENEKNLRELYPEEGEDGEEGDQNAIFGNQIKQYKNRIKNEQKNMETEIYKNEIFQKLIEFGKDFQEDNRQFFDWLLEDYYLLFLAENLQDIKNSFNDLEDYKNFLKKMVYLRFNLGNEEETDPIRLIAMKMVWLESNSEYISILLNIYKKISLQEKNLFMKIDKIINNNEIKYEISVRVLAHTEEVNAPYFYIMESLLKLLTTDPEIYINLKGQDYYDFINALKGIAQDALRIVRELDVFSKEVFTIQQFLSIEENFNFVNKSNSENILKVLQILSEHSSFMNEILVDNLKYEGICNSIQKLYEFLKENLGNTDNFIQLMLNYFVAEIKKVENDYYYKKIISIILENPKLLTKSYPFMNYLIRILVTIDPDSILENLDKMKNNQNLHIELINNANNDILNEIILSIFENQFNSYFDSIPNMSIDDLEKYFPRYFEYQKTHGKNNPCFILFDLSLDLFKNCTNFLEAIFNNRKDKKEEKINNENLCILYCIAYLKMYLNKCMYYNHTNNQEFLYFDEIHKAIEGNANNYFRKMIKIYAFKVFFYLLNNNYQDFASYHYPTHGINFFEEFKEKFNEKKEAMLSYYLIPTGEEFNKYQKELELFESYKFNDFSNPVKQFKEYIEKNGIDIFYTVSTNIIVSNLGLKM